MPCCTLVKQNLRLPGFAVCLCLFFFCGLNSFAQQEPYIPFKHFSSANGLSQNHVESIVQDKEGFMWFGTAEGLNRFDGYEFTVYRHINNDSTSIPHDNINDMYIDHNGEIWLGTVDGVARFNPSTNNFSSIRHNPAQPTSISWGRVNRILEDPIGNFWIAFLTGMVDYFDRRTNTFTHYAIASDVTGKGIYGEATALMLDREGNLWIGTFQGITVMNPNKRIARTYKHTADITSITSNTVHDIIQDSHGRIWVGTDSGVNLYNEDTNNFTRFVHDDNNSNTLGRNVVRRLKEDREGRLWMATENGGLDIFDYEASTFYHYRENKAHPTTIADNSLYALYRDKLDNMWIGTNAQGVEFYDRFTKPFMVYQSSPGLATNLSHDKVTAITEEPGKGIWVGTDGGGLNFFDPTTNVFTAYRSRKGDHTTIQSDFVVDVLWDPHANCLWVATWGGGLSRFDTKTKKAKTYFNNPKDPTSLAYNDLWRLYLDNEGILYVGTIGGGVSIYDRKHDVFESFSTQQGLAEKNVVSFYRDGQGRLWMGGWERGISCFDLKQRKFLPTPTGLTMNAVNSIIGDSTDRIWFTGHGGIICYNPRKNEITHFSKTDGLPGSTVLAMLPDDRGYFWLSTNKGIVKFDPIKRSFQVFNTEDGLPTDQFGERLFRDRAGRLYFGSVKGLVAFMPDSIRSNPNVPPVWLTDLKVFNRSVVIGGADRILAKSISETKEIFLPPQDNFFTLNFVALNFTSTKRNDYLYRLQGFDKDWLHSTSRSASYTNLDPGTYTFYVHASNNDGLWNERGSSLVIHILPPWWRTWWFRTILVVGGFIAMGLVIAVRTQNIQRANKMLEETVRQKTRELQSTNKALRKREEEIEAKNRILREQSDELAAQNEELIQNQEEISSQRDQLSHQNQSLEGEVAKRTQELVEYNHQLEQFAFISAHNLRAPVARILGLGQLLAMAKENGQEREAIYPKLVNTTRELDNVVKDLNTILDLKKNSNTFITTIDLSEALRSTLENLEREIVGAHARIHINLDEVQTINTVRVYLDSILYNLISNAIKYRHPNRDPIITIKTQRVGPEVCISVADNGLGVDVNQFQEKLFTLYSRFHLHIEGKGMGLYLVKTQMNALGGRIEVDSTVGVGTTFRAYFK